MKTLQTLIFLFLVSSGLWAQKASIHEATMTFRTYGYSDPDPVARPGKIYPYYRFDGYTNSPVDKDWKIIVMENDWIRVLIAPEIGGKILGAIEKTTGNEFLYFNKVIKFRDVAMRGAWTSGGIEFNFGSIGHAPSTASPVDYLISENPDGSVSCFLGAMDLSSRTEWRVEVRLPNDRAWFETHASWYNPSDFSTSKYQWMNAAADASDDLTYYWPGTHYIGHPGDSHAWPVMADGRDISQYAQNNYGTYHSYHVLGEIKDYYGGYYKNRDFGFGHLTDYAVKPGKKIWIWGLSRQGEIWVDLLTDPDLGNGQYTEIQTGILFNQAAVESTKSPYKHLDFKSKDVERFTEYWFPVKQTGGITDINEYGILNLIPGSGSTSPEIRFCALQPIQDSITVLVNDSLIYKFALNLEPMEVFAARGSAQSSVNSAPTRIKFQASLPSLPKEGPGVDLPRSSDRPKTAPESFNWNSLQGKYYTALENSRQREYVKALEGFFSCLEEDQNYIPALVGAAEELMRTSQYDKAENLIRRVLAIDTYHPQANYLYGIVKKREGEYYRAVEAFGLCTRNMEYRSAAFSQLSEVSLLLKDYKKALSYATSALDYNRFNVSAYQLSSLAHRLSGSEMEAEHSLEGLLGLDPLNHMARFELFLLTKNPEALKAFQTTINTEFPEQVYLELAFFYKNLGLYREASQVLEKAPDHILIRYLQAYLNKKMEEPPVISDPESNIQFIFPFRQEFLTIFQDAEKGSPNWQNRYFMGLMYWNYGQLDEARNLFRSCGDEPDFAAFYLARTKLFDKIDTELVIHDLERALKLDPNSWRSYKYLVEFYLNHSAYPQALEYARKSARKFHSNFIVQADLAKLELYNKNYKKALDILEDLNILPAEGAREGHDIYRQAHVLQAVDAYKNGKTEKALDHIAIAREWPENLGVGRPYETDERIEDYLQGIILMAEGKDTEAVQAFQRIVDYTKTAKPGFDSPYLLLAYSLQILGQEELAVQTLSDWMKMKYRDPICNWATALYGNQTVQAERALGITTDSGREEPWNHSGDSQFRMVYEIVNQIRLK